MVAQLNTKDLMFEEITNALYMVFEEDIYVSKALMKIFKNHKEWNDQEKGYFSDTIYDIVRYWRLLWYLLKKEQSFEKNDLLQLIDVFNFYKEKRTSQSHINYNDLKNSLNLIKDVRVLRESIPDWLDSIGINELGKRWDSVIEALNKKPSMVIRTNTLKCTTEKLVKLLQCEGIYSEKKENAKDALVIRDERNIFRLESFQKGLFEQQSYSSQMVSIFLDVKPGMRIIDVCAGEGSKTLHLAALMDNKGKIIAMDTAEWKLKELKRRTVKAGVENIEIRPIDSSKTYKRLKGTADRLLLDVPCSGLGTLRRNPDIKWKLTLLGLKRLKELQKELLERYYILLKRGGQMVYSVCSILPSEGEMQVKNFLERHKNNLRLIKEKRFWPDTDDTDGFYMALIEQI
jgi:16S rRNA (cytosine967-C5)-methyltransferase